MTAESGAAEVACSPAQKRWVLAAAILGSSLAFVDGTVVNVALPAIQRELSASVYQAQWVVESYALLLAALLLAAGALGDRFGRRQVFLLGTAVFGVASVGCMLAPGVRWLIAARAVQGAGAALLVPGSLALVHLVFAPQERGKAFGTWAGASAVASAGGPLLGGFLVDRFSWAWAFALNIPLSVLVLAIAWKHVPEGRRAGAAARLDFPGALLATLALGGIVFAFIEAPTRQWRSAAVLAALAIGIASLVAFLLVERRQPAPMLPLGLLRNRNFAGANLLTLLLYAALGGGLFFLPLNLIQVQGLSATAAGAALLPFIAIMFALSRWAGALVERHGARGPLVVGPAIAAVGFALLVLPGTHSGYLRGFFPGIAVLGLGMAIAVAPLTTTVMNAVDGDKAGVASAINNAVSRVAALLAIAVFGWLMASVFGPRLHEGLAAAHVPADVVDKIWSQRDKLAAIAAPGAGAQVVKDAFVAGYRWIMAASAGLALASAVVAGLMLDSAAGRRAPAARES
ncbi:MFS transporter [Ramlibacter sp. G-1-2-2]|uniref:MFS transporter n=1 Tax=Ramlibacter agri TaxID=2728837 RepID=A0A848H889_9BURK|nr:MFS transporter [Ramlibacter agri]NML47005.1 MFS transporter [Ramlibacter agri]